MTVAGVVDESAAEAVDGVRAEHLVDLRRGDTGVEDVDALAAEPGVHGEVGGKGELVAEADAPSGPRLGPIVERSGVVGRARRQADPGVEEIGLLEGRRVALQLRARGRFETEPLTGSSEGGAVADVVPAPRQAGDVEVLLVDDDVADETGIGVDAGTDHEAAGLRFLGVDIDDDIRLLAGEHLRRLGKPWLEPWLESWLESWLKSWLKLIEVS